MKACFPAGSLQAQHMRLLTLQCLAEAASSHNTHPQSEALLNTAVEVAIPTEEFKLRSIPLSAHQCGVLGQVICFAPHVTKLTLHNCGIGKKQCTALVSTGVLQSLTDLCLDYNSTVRGVGLREIAQSLGESCKRLSVGGCKLDNEDGRTLGHLMKTSKHLEILDCRNNQFAEEGLVSLSHGLATSSLVELRIFLNRSAFSSPRAIDVFCGALQMNRRLSKLWLNICSLDDASAERIMRATRGRLSYLNMSLNQLTDKICEEALDFLLPPSFGQTPTEVDPDSGCEHQHPSSNVACAGSSDDGMLGSILRSPGRNKRNHQDVAVHLHLSGNTISYQAIERLAISMPKPNSHTVSFGYCEISSPDCSVTFLNVHLEHCLQSSDQSSPELSLRFFGVGDEGATRLAECVRRCKLTTLDLTYNNISDVGWAAIVDTMVTDCSKSTLKLAGNNISDVRNPHTVITECSLSALELYGNNVTLAGLETWLSRLAHANAFPRLQLLSFQENSLFHDRCLGSGETFGRTITKLLTQLPSLRYLNLWETGLSVRELPYLADGLVSNSSLHCIFLGGNQIGNEGAEVLSHVVQKNSSLRLLELTEAGIGDEGAVSLGRMQSQREESLVIYMGGNPASPALYGEKMIDGYLWHGSLAELSALLDSF